MSIEGVIQKLKTLPTGFIVDALNLCGIAGWTVGVVPITRRSRCFVGRAVTMSYAPKRGTGPKQSSHYQLIRESNPGDVLVMAAQGTPCWVLGENVCHVAEYQGMAAVIVDGCVRDGDELAEFTMPVFCRGTSVKPYYTHLELVGINVPVEFAGAQIRPGDILAGDGDGIAIVPPERAVDVLFQACFIEEMEKAQEKAISDKAPLQVLMDLTNKKKTPKKKNE